MYIGFLYVGYLSIANRQKSAMYSIDRKSPEIGDADLPRIHAVGPVPIQ